MRHLRISLRLMLLMVALAAIVFALIGVWRKQQQEQAQARIRELKMMRQFATQQLASHPEEGTTWRTSIGQIDAELSEKQAP